MIYCYLFLNIANIVHISVIFATKGMEMAVFLDIYTLIFLGIIIIALVLALF